VGRRPFSHVNDPRGQCRACPRLPPRGPGKRPIITGPAQNRGRTRVAGGDETGSSPRRPPARCPTGEFKLDGWKGAESPAVHRRPLAGLLAAPPQNWRRRFRFFRGGDRTRKTPSRISDPIGRPRFARPRAFAFVPLGPPGKGKRSTRLDKLSWRPRGLNLPMELFPVHSYPLNDPDPGPACGLTLAGPGVPQDPGGLAFWGKTIVVQTNCGPGFFLPIAALFFFFPAMGAGPALRVGRRTPAGSWSEPRRRGRRGLGPRPMWWEHWPGASQNGRGQCGPSRRNYLAGKCSQIFFPGQPARVRRRPGGKISVPKLHPRPRPARVGRGGNFPFPACFALARSGGEGQKINNFPPGLLWAPARPGRKMGLSGVFCADRPARAMALRPGGPWGPDWPSGGGPKQTCRRN